MKRCLTCGDLTKASRCSPCQKGVNNARDAAPERLAHKRERYNAEFKSMRRHWASLFESGYTANCARCGGLLTGAEAWDLDHLDNGMLSPSHARCNRAAGGKRAD